MNHDAISVQLCLSAGLTEDQADLLLNRLKGAPAFPRATAGKSLTERLRASPTSAIMLEAADYIDRLRAAAERVDALYPNVWDLVDGGLFIMPENVKRFDDAFDALRTALSGEGK